GAGHQHVDPSQFGHDLAGRLLDRAQVADVRPHPGGPDAGRSELVGGPGQVRAREREQGNDRARPAAGERARPPDPGRPAGDHHYPFGHDVPGVAPVIRPTSSMPVTGRSRMSSSAIFRPSRSTATRSATLSTWSMLWLTRMVPMPSRLSLVMSPSTASVC